MKNKKAISWEKLSEGIITANEIQALSITRVPIALSLTDSKNPSKVNTILIKVQRGPSYDVINNLTSPNYCVNKKPYKYLSCAVRKAVKEYKTALRSGNWRILTKV